MIDHIQFVVSPHLLRQLEAIVRDMIHSQAGRRLVDASRTPPRCCYSLWKCTEGDEYWFCWFPGLYYENEAEREEELTHWRTSYPTVAWQLLPAQPNDVNRSDFAVQPGDYEKFRLQQG